MPYDNEENMRSCYLEQVMQVFFSSLLCRVAFWMKCRNRLEFVVNEMHIDRKILQSITSDDNDKNNTSVTSKNDCGH